MWQRHMEDKLTASLIEINYDIRMIKSGECFLFFQDIEA